LVGALVHTQRDAQPCVRRPHHAPVPRHGRQRAPPARRARRRFTRVWALICYRRLTCWSSAASRWILRLPVLAARRRLLPSTATARRAVGRVGCGGRPARRPPPGREHRAGRPAPDDPTAPDNGARSSCAPGSRRTCGGDTLSPGRRFTMQNPGRQVRLLCLCSGPADRAGGHRGQSSVLKPRAWCCGRGEPGDDPADVRAGRCRQGGLPPAPGPGGRGWRPDPAGSGPGGRRDWRPAPRDTETPCRIVTGKAECR
jgi:hypothetical protein